MTSGSNSECTDIVMRNCNMNVLDGEVTVPVLLFSCGPFHFTSGHYKGTLLPECYSVSTRNPTIQSLSLNENVRRNFGGVSLDVSQTDGSVASCHYGLITSRVAHTPAPCPSPSIQQNKPWATLGPWGSRVSFYPPSLDHPPRWERSLV